MELFFFFASRRENFKLRTNFPEVAEVERDFAHWQVENGLAEQLFTWEVVNEDGEFEIESK